jgi:hypothetical protein
MIKSGRKKDFPVPSVSVFVPNKYLTFSYSLLFCRCSLMVNYYWVRPLGVESGSCAVISIMVCVLCVYNWTSEIDTHTNMPWIKLVQEIATELIDRFCSWDNQREHPIYWLNRWSRTKLVNIIIAIFWYLYRAKWHSHTHTRNFSIYPKITVNDFAWLVNIFCYDGNDDRLWW